MIIDGCYGVRLASAIAYGDQIPARISRPFELEFKLLNLRFNSFLPKPPFLPVLGTKVPEIRYAQIWHYVANFSDIIDYFR